MNRRDFLIRLGLAVPAVKTIVCFGTGIWRPVWPLEGFVIPGTQRHNFSIHDTNYAKMMLAEIDRVCGVLERFMDGSRHITATEMMMRLDIQHQKTRYRGTIRVEP